MYIVDSERFILLHCPAGSQDGVADAGLLRFIFWRVGREKSMGERRKETVMYTRPCIHFDMSYTKHAILYLISHAPAAAQRRGS